MHSPSIIQHRSNTIESEDWVPFLAHRTSTLNLQPVPLERRSSSESLPSDTLTNFRQLTQTNSLSDTLLPFNKLQIRSDESSTLFVFIADQHTNLRKIRVADIDFRQLNAKNISEMISSRYSTDRNYIRSSARRKRRTHWRGKTARCLVSEENNAKHYYYKQCLTQLGLDLKTRVNNLTHIMREQRQTNRQQTGNT